MDVQHQHAVDVPAAADAPQAGDEANGSVNSVGPQDVQNSSPPQEAAAAGGNASPGNAAAQGQSAAAQQDDEDKEFLDKMRGWLMTVGTLFVTMAFQAALHPPEWMNTAATAPAMQFAHSRGPSPQAAESTTGLSARAQAYLGCNVFTFATALSLVLLLLWDIPPARAKRTMRVAAGILVVIAISVGATLVLGISKHWSDTLGTVLGIELCTCGTIFIIIVVLKIQGGRTGERTARSRDHAS